MRNFDLLLVPNFRSTTFTFFFFFPFPSDPFSSPPAVPLDPREGRELPIRAPPTLSRRRDGDPDPPAETRDRAQRARGGEVAVVVGDCRFGYAVSPERFPQGILVFDERSRVAERAVGLPRVPGRREGDLCQPPRSARRRASHRHRGSRQGRACFLWTSL